MPDPLSLYLREIDAVPLLTVAEEKALAHRIADGDSEARERMIRANLRLVVKIALYFRGRGLDLSDLISEGNAGLIRAADRFDASKDIKFSTYASYWIKQSITRALSNTGRPIRLPYYLAALIPRWRAAARDLRDRLGRPATSKEIGDVLGLSRKSLKIAVHALRVCDAEIQTDHPDHNYEFPDTQAPDSEANLIHAETIRLLRHRVDTLPPRESFVIRLRFGLMGDTPMDRNAIGVRLGLHRDRVKRIESQALARLAKCFSSDPE